MKRDLYFSKPIMNSAGSLGFAPDPRNGIDLDSFGAFITNPISLRSRLPAAQPAVIEFPGGFLLHTGLPNDGLSSVIKKHGARWNRADMPIIVNLMADRPEETQQMVRSLENIENVMAVELGFAPLLSDDIILLNLEMCVGELPLIFSLPAEQVLSLGPKLIQGGAAAISISSPRGALPLTSTSSSEKRKIRHWQAVWPIIISALIGSCPLGGDDRASYHWSGRGVDRTRRGGYAVSGGNGCRNRCPALGAERSDLDH